MKRLLDKIMFKLETRIIFYPMRKYYDEMITELQDLVEIIHFHSEKNIELTAWYIEKTQPNKPTILYCHGQAEHIAYYQKPYQVLAENGYGVFATEYRGHGKSAGIPSEKGIYKDIEAAINYLETEKGIKKEDMVIWGRSMGGAIAAEIASKYNFRGVILESTFTTLKDAALYIINSGCDHPIFGPKRKFLFRLAQYIPAKQTFDTVSKIHKIKSPLFIAHCKEDVIIDYRMAQTNAEKHGSARLFIAEEGSHDHSDWAYDEVLKFLETVD
jgi:hypothetical protein